MVNELFCDEGWRCEGCPARNLPFDVRAAIPGTIKKIQLRLGVAEYYHSVIGIIASRRSLIECGIEHPNTPQVQGVAQSAARIVSGQCDHYQVTEENT